MRGRSCKQNKTVYHYTLSSQLLVGYTFMFLFTLNCTCTLWSVFCAANRRKSLRPKTKCNTSCQMTCLPNNFMPNNPVSHSATSSFPEYLVLDFSCIINWGSCCHAHICQQVTTKVTSTPLSTPHSTGR